jgi:DNA repair exonuclease SbcCD ATPase subunit
MPLTGPPDNQGTGGISFGASMSYLDGRESSERKGRNMKTMAVFAVATLWLLAEAAKHLSLLPADGTMGAMMLGAAPNFFAPIMLLLIGWILLDLLRAASARVPVASDPGAANKAIEDAVDEVDDAVEAAARKAAQIQADISEQAKTMKAAATRLDRAGLAALEGGTAIGTALTNLEERLPPLLKSADEAEKALLEATVSLEGQIAAFDDVLQSMRQRSASVADEAVEAVSRMKASLAQIDEVSEHTTQLVANRAYALDGAVTGVLERSVVVLDNIRESLLAQGHAIETSVREARQELEACGQQSSAEIAVRMDELIARARALETLVQGNQERAMALTSHLDAWMAATEARLEQLRTTAHAELEGLKTGLLEAQDDAETTMGRIGSAQASATELQGLTATFGPNIDAFQSSVQGQLPGIEQSLGKVGDLSDHVRTRVEELVASVESCAALLENLSKARAEEQEKFDALVARFMAANVR